MDEQRIREIVREEIAALKIKSEEQLFKNNRFVERLAESVGEAVSNAMNKDRVIIID